MASIGYTGIEPGISDPRVFDKPRECSALPEEVCSDDFRFEQLLCLVCGLLYLQFHFFFT